MSEHRYSAEVRTSYLIVRQQGALGSVAAARGMQATIDRLRQEHRILRLLFDNRDTLPASDEVRSCMWTWIRGSNLERVALLLQSEMAVVRANMDALAGRTRLKAFSSEKAAVAWLTGK